MGFVLGLRLSLEIKQSPKCLPNKGLFINYVIRIGGRGGKPKDDTKMTEGRVGVWEKMTDDNDRKATVIKENRA